MSIPKKHHYLPKFFMRRWADSEGNVTEYRRPREALVGSHKSPASTGFIHELYSNTNKDDPIERQALELVFMQKVDDRAATALSAVDQCCGKPNNPLDRDAWSRFLMSLMHRSPQRVKYLTEKVRTYETGDLNPEMNEKYAELRSENDPPTYEEWLAGQKPMTPDLTVRLLRLMIDSRRIGDTLNSMKWRVHKLTNARFGFLTGDHPIMMSNGLGYPKSFVALAISPASVFLAANDQAVMDAFISQTQNAIERAFNDACVRQSQYVVIAGNDSQRMFVDKRFLKLPAPVGANGFASWNSPLIDV